MQKPKLLVVIGTRPEAIKLAPVIRELRKESYPFEPYVLCTGQHEPRMVLGTLEFFEIKPDEVDNVLEQRQSLTRLSSLLLESVQATIDAIHPVGTIVQGDTQSAVMGALASFYAQVPVFHVEAGLRTHDLSNPFPEEGNRQIISRVADLHFTPTWQASKNLDNEGIGPPIIQTGNTVVDALAWTRRQLGEPTADAPPVLVTCHRRENRPVLEVLIEAVIELANMGYPVLWPAHPSIRDQLIMRAQSKREHAHPRSLRLREPLPYLDFLRALMSCRLVITDSGGVQEEAPAFGKPVLVFRRSTERREAISAGTAKLVESQAGIVHEARRLLEDPAIYARMSAAKNPFGDGQAAGRIGLALVKRFGALPIPRAI